MPLSLWPELCGVFKRRIEKESGMNIGDVRGRLTLLDIIKKSTPSGQPRHYGVFKCSCGNTTTTLLTGITKSCGCLISQTLRDRRKTTPWCRKPFPHMTLPEYAAKYLKYDKSTGKIYRNVKKHGDIEVINTHSNGYNRIPVLVDGKSIKIYHHRMVWFFETGELPNNEVDHIDGNKQNNHISNLRVVDRRLNCLNSKHRRNKGLYSIAILGQKGGHKYSRDLGYKYQIMFPQFLVPFRKQICIGYAKTEDEAKEMLCKNVSEWVGFTVKYEDFLNRDFKWPEV